MAFLVRGGRVNGVGSIGGLLKLIPVMRKTEDGRRLEKHSIARTMKKAIRDVVKRFKAKGCYASYKYFVSHAFNDEIADEFIKVIKEEFKADNIEKLIVSPVFLLRVVLSVL